jgi:hypothetical protein
MLPAGVCAHRDGHRALLRLRTAGPQDHGARPHFRCPSTLNPQLSSLNPHALPSSLHPISSINDYPRE